MRVDDLDLAFAVTETGPADADPVIVLPGGPCRGPEYLSDLAGLDSTRRRVVLHPRGTPRSGGLSRGWWQDADDVAALVDALGMDAAHLIAHSAGTRLALPGPPTIGSPWSSRPPQRCPEPRPGEGRAPLP